MGPFVSVFTGLVEDYAMYSRSSAGNTALLASPEIMRESCMHGQAWDLQG